MDVRGMARTMGVKIGTMITRGVISRVNDALATQGLQIELRDQELADDAEHFQPYGLSFHPAVDSEVVVLAIGGAQDHLIAVNATNRAQRPTGVDEGEGGLYNPTGWKVFLAADDIVHLSEKTAADFVALASKVESELDLIKQSLSSHTHAYIACAGGTSPAVIQPGQKSVDFGYEPQPVAAEKVKAT